jgi:bifunctional pyridoxal-dependent enzyme with beta-cystathionase and maltose regulon repressor activities
LRGHRWNWDLDPASVTAVTDVGVGVVELLRVLTRPGDAVVISPAAGRAAGPRRHWGVLAANCASVGPDDQAQQRFLSRGRVALEPGLRFGAARRGAAGNGYARLNFATSAGLLDAATARMTESIG